MQCAEPNHYATLGLDRRCTTAQIRAAYRLLAKQHHPDLHRSSADSVRHTQALNAAHEILSDPEQRLAYDQELKTARPSVAPARNAKLQRHLSQEAFLKIEDFLKGTTLNLRVNDPANPAGAEVYELIIPPGTAPGTKFRLPRIEPMTGGVLTVRVRAQPGFRFKVRGSDLRCDLKIKAERAAQGGVEMLQGILGTRLRVQIPKGAGRNEIIRVPGEGLPKPRGGRGDLLVRVSYQVKIRVTRQNGR